MDVVNKRLIAGAMKMEENGINNKSDKNDKDKDDDDNNKDLFFSDELEEPIPRNEHKYCHICKTKFEKYLKHIKCYSHFENLQRHQSFFNRIRKSFERIINFWDIKKGKNIKNKNNIEAKENITKFVSPIKSEEISTKEGSHQDKNIINNLINLLNNGNNNENINNNTRNNIIKNNNSEIIIKNNIGNNIKRPLANSNIDLNKPPKNTQNLFNTSYNNNNNKKEEKTNNKIFTPFTPFINPNSLKKKCNTDHIFNLTYNNNNNNNSINNNFNNNLFKNENKNSIKTVNYISINKKDEENLITKTPDKNKSIGINNKNENVPVQPKKKFVIKCFPKFSTLQTFQLTKPKKRKKNDFYKGGDIFVISTPKKIDFDYFPILSVDNPKKLINKSIVFFQ